MPAVIAAEHAGRPPVWPPPAVVLAGVLGVVAVVAAGLLALLSSSGHQLHDPVHALQQLDLLYLDEPAPAYEALGLEPGRPALIVVCAACQAPAVTGAQVAVTDDPAVAAAYALATVDGRIGPGYAVVDPAGRVRYRTFDPFVGEHAAEVQILLDALR